jgi:hypothetical protein
MNTARRGGWGLLSALLVCAGCGTAGPLPPADFSAPGWQVQSGQAVWHPPADRPELAGDLLLATNADGNCFIQFSKMPFPLVTARISGDRWEIEFGAHEHTWHGTGAPPDRFAWFQLPGALLGANPPGSWRFARLAGQSWRLENSRTGEKLEGVFSP